MTCYEYLDPIPFHRQDARWSPAATDELYRNASATVEMDRSATSTVSRKCFSRMLGAISAADVDPLLRQPYGTRQHIDHVPIPPSDGI